MDAPVSLSRPEILRLLDRHRKSFASRSASALAADHVEDGTFFSPASGEMTGRHDIMKVYEYWLEAFPDLTFSWNDPIIEGNRVALFWHFSGTVAGRFFGEVKPGTRIEFDGAGQYVFSPDGIVSVRHLFDFTGALITAGVLKVKPM